MKIAVIGSREGFSYEQVRKVIYNTFDKVNDRLITGGARGIDTFAEQIINKDFHFYKSPQIIKPINPANKLDYLFRNVEIITQADKIIAFWDGKSRGTKFTMDYAKARNKEMIIYDKPKS